MFIFNHAVGLSFCNYSKNNATDISFLYANSINYDTITITGNNGLALSVSKTY